MPLITGVVVRCRPVGMLKMTDKAGEDAKLLAVPIGKLYNLYRDVESPRDPPELTLSQIAHFFEHYKDLEPGKWVKVQGWVGAEETKAEIMDGMKRYQEAAQGNRTILEQKLAQKMLWQGFSPRRSADAAESQALF